MSDTATYGQPEAGRQTLVRRSLHSWRTRIGLFMLLSVCGVAALGALVAPYPPNAMLSVPFAQPSADYLFGTDMLGRDVLSRFLAGGRSLVWMSVTATLLGVSVGVLLGIFAAYKRGITEQILMRLVDIKFAFPTVVLALLLVTMFGPGKLLLVAIVGISQAPGVARVIRGAALQVVEREFVLHAQAIGLSSIKIVAREILPNVTTPIMVEFGLRMMWSISALAGLSFLGYGIQPPDADWGVMINENRNALSNQPWAVLLPMLAVAAFTIGSNLFAEGISRAVGRTES